MMNHLIYSFQLVMIMDYNVDIKKAFILKRMFKSNCDSCSKNTNKLFVGKLANYNLNDNDFDLDKTLNEVTFDVSSCQEQIVELHNLCASDRSIDSNVKSLVDNMFDEFVGGVP